VTAAERDVERILASRVEQGLPPTVTDPDVLALVSSVLARNEGPVAA
jgi:hypothetical protein